MYIVDWVVSLHRTGHLVVGEVNDLAFREGASCVDGLYLDLSWSIVTVV